MKKFLFTVGLLLVALCIAAQTEDDYSWYLNKAKEQLGKGECEKAERNYIHYKNLAHDSLPQLYRQIQECIWEHAQAREKIDTEIVFVPVQVPVIESKPESKPEIKEDFKNENKSADFSKNRDNPYCKAKRNRYIAWAVAGAGYPWNVVTGIELRGGGVWGVGGYADIGMDFSPISCAVQYVDVYHNMAEEPYFEKRIIKTSFRYIGGVRLFYKGLFLSVSYGSVANMKSVVSLEYDGGFPEQYAKDARKMVHNGHGPQVHVGYNLVTPSANGFFLGISGGFAYDIVNKVFVPSFNLKLGMSFEWKKY